MDELKTVFLFANHAEGLKLNRALRELGIPSTIIPTPRQLSGCCGLSLMLAPEHEAAAHACAEAAHVMVQDCARIRMNFNSSRDTYC